MGRESSLKMNSGFLFVFSAALQFFIAFSLFAAPLKLAVTDISGLEELQREFVAFQNELGRLTGEEFKLFPVSSRTAAVEALKFKKVDFVLTGPAEYIVIEKRAGAVPVVGFSRPNYYSAVVVRADSDILEVSDLENKKIALGDVGSTSYYLAPLQLLKDGGLKPRDGDLKIHSVSKQVAWVSLKRKSVDAIGFGYERFRLFVEKDSEVELSDFRVIARGPDLPNDVLVAGKHVSPEIVSKVRDAFGNNSDTLINAVLQGERSKKYGGMKFLTNITDRNYDYIRKMYATAGFPEYADKG